MPTRRTLSVCAFALLPFAAAPTQAQTHHNIVIVSGQSNARPAYAEGIMSTLLAEGSPESPLLYHRRHSGSRLNRWIGGTPGAYTLEEFMLTDLWSPDGTSGLQQQISDIEAIGDTWDITAFFWFQGEGDSGSAYQQSLYAGRFMHMLNTIEAGYGLDHEIPFIMTAIDYNGDDEWLADIGRTPEDIEAMRAVQFGIGQSVPHGATFDSRGWPRLDLWHVGSFDDPRGYYGPVMDLGGEEAMLLLTLPVPASRADLNADSIHDLRDVALFVQWFVEQDPRADIAAPAGVYDLFDSNLFINTFLSNVSGD